MVQFSPAARELIVSEEVSSKAYYDKLCRGFEWPGGASGPTVAIGYDCGYSSRAEIDADWRGRISDAQVEVLKSAAGLTGQSAKGFVANHRYHVNISWEVANTQFDEVLLPRWITRTANALPNFSLLPLDCQGVLVSLTYNRGPSYRASGPRLTEMNAIYRHMQNKQFDRIPAELLSMRRLWPNRPGLVKRRANEAALFKRGLSNN